MINLSDLDDDQRRAATAPRGPVCILAGAGTGKTRTITYRIAHLIDQGFVSQNRVLAVTFTNRAAAEMRHRLALMGIGGVQARTFHSAALRQLKYFWPQIAGTLPWRMLDGAFPLVARAARGVSVDSNKENLRDLLGEIEWAKASLITPEQYAEAVVKAQRTPPFAAEKVAQVYAQYEAAKTTDGGMLLDFNDLLLHTAGALENSPAVAEEFREQYRSFVVDEYQDVTPLQQRVLQAWLGERDDITVVGDANQTIYSFTGATPNYLLDFSRTYPHATVTRLQRDYRSTPEITTLANSIIGKATGRVAGTRLELIGMRPSGPQPTFSTYLDEPTEAREIAKRIKKLLDQGTPASEIAILYRMNAQSAVFEQALADEDIVYQVRGGEGFFQRNEIKQAMTQLIRAAQRTDLPAEAIGPRVAVVARAALARMGLTKEQPEGAEARERWQMLNALVDLIEELGTASPEATLQDILVMLRQRAEAKAPPTVEGVTLASLHAAKGLEWDAVFLAGLVENTLPISFAVKAGEEQIEEERRLFYVGVTRAREHLYCSWAQARQEGGRASRKRSRFLEGIVVDAAEDRPRSKSRRRCRSCGQPLTTPVEKTLGRCEDCPPTDNGLFDRLREWRLEMAKEKNVPAYVVFTDATLMAVAETRPSTEEELLGVSGIGPIKAAEYGESLLQVLSLEA